MPALPRACPHAETDAEKSTWADAVLGSIRLSPAELFFEEHQDEWCLKAQEFAEQAWPDDAELAFRRGWWNNRLKRYAYRQAIARGAQSACPRANLARLLVVRAGRPAEAATRYREVARRAQPDEQALLLQARLFLGNRQLGVDALQALSRRARGGDQYSFFRLKEQVWECHEIGFGLGERLADWMRDSAQGVFLQPFVQPLYVLARADGKPGDPPLESRQLVDEIVRQARER